MPAAMVDAHVEDFEKVLKLAEVQGPGLLLLLFLGDRDPSIGHSWCPDCVRAEPVIYKAVEDSPKDVTLLRSYVGNKPEWRNPDHPWRHDPRFRLRGVPTLIRWEAGKVVSRLEDDEAHIPKNVEAIIS